MVPAAPGASTVTEVSPQTPRGVAARMKLAELKRGNVLCEIGRGSCSAGPAAGKINLIVSELCTTIVDTSPPTEFGASETFGPMLPGEDVNGVETMERVKYADRVKYIDRVEYIDKEVPDPRDLRERGGGYFPDQGGFDPGPAAGNTERQGWTEGGAVEARASRGVLLEFVWPPAQRSTGQGHDQGKPGPHYVRYYALAYASQVPCTVALYRHPLG